MSHNDNVRNRFTHAMT